MESSVLLSLLVLSLLLVNVQGPALTDWFFPQRCPRIQGNCEFKERDECSKNKKCPKHEKCCFFSCGRKCLNLQQDICSMPKEAGPCMALFHRWWYDKTNNSCSSFIYGGCRGNNNNFQSQAVCQSACSAKGHCPRNRVRCEIQERNLCTNSRDCPKKMKCCQFSCGKKCLDVDKDVCTLPKVPGPCNAYFVRWWYDQQKETCSSFIYGGCQGNNNNFQSESVCHAICPQRRSVSWLG
ncbi:eppin isoform X1 [Bos taurus]|uniref:eppin isoform X1 n=1 Tax=Bos taurus TaxID=9913 RepID=UPI000572D4E8|nr:eppin isoform X1 [Bos taurus]